MFYSSSEKQAHTGCVLRKCSTIPCCTPFHLEPVPLGPESSPIHRCGWPDQGLGRQAAEAHALLLCTQHRDVLGNKSAWASGGGLRQAGSGVGCCHVQGFKVLGLRVISAHWGPGCLCSLSLDGDGLAVILVCCFEAGCRSEVLRPAINSFKQSQHINTQPCTVGHAKPRYPRPHNTPIPRKHTLFGRDCIPATCVLIPFMHSLLSYQPMSRLRTYQTGNTDAMVGTHYPCCSGPATLSVTILAKVCRQNCATERPQIVKHGAVSRTEHCHFCTLARRPSIYRHRQMYG